MNVLHVASEMYPLLKTGGLADVVGALPIAQRQIGHDARILIPAYPAILKALPDCPEVAQFSCFAGEVTIRYGEFSGVGIYLLEAPNLYARDGNPYYDENYHDYGDNYLRFALLGYIGAQLADGIDRFWQPEVVHVHDWHAGLTCAYVKHLEIDVKSIFTIHNIAYHGLFDAKHLAEIDLPHSFFNVDGLEFHGQLSYLKAGIYYADEVTTVSPTFAKEILGEELSFGLHGLLQDIDDAGHLQGVLNGIDENVWNPEADALLSAHYKIGAMQGKMSCKSSLQKIFDLPENKKVPLFVMVSRLTEQKGLDILLKSMQTIIKSKGQVAILGSGDAYFEKALTELAAEEANISVRIGYDEDLAHLLIAGGDVILVPSRFEPCGLTQLYALRYGTLPLVRRTGGLADTVTHVTDETFKLRTATGFVFEEMNEVAMSAAIKSVFTLWRTPRKWSNIRANAMRENHSWTLVAKQYDELYISSEALR